MLLADWIRRKWLMNILTSRVLTFAHDWQIQWYRHVMMLAQKDRVLSMLIDVALDSI